MICTKLATTGLIRAGVMTVMLGNVLNLASRILAHIFFIGLYVLYYL